MEDDLPHAIRHLGRPQARHLEALLHRLDRLHRDEGMTRGELPDLLGPVGRARTRAELLLDLSRYVVSGERIAEIVRIEPDVRDAVDATPAPPFRGEIRFDRVSFLALGYNVKEVDRFADRLTRYFRDGWPIAIDDVRGVVFTAQRGGYRESQVDLVLDAVVDVMLAVR